MIDSHVHIERGPYTLDWINKFISYAIKKGISQLYLLEHTHRFIEFKQLYENVINYNSYQANWLSNRLNINFSDYLKLIEQCKKQTFPINIKWGLEICYFSEMEDFIFNCIIKDSHLDFHTGSIHYINYWGFDHKPEFWENRDVDFLYQKYYEEMILCVKSGLFDHLAHPDSIKCFNYYPKIDMNQLYTVLSESLERNKIKAEYSSGLYNNYGHINHGINPQLLSYMLSHNVELISASDAHKPEDVGKVVSPPTTV